MTKHALSEAEDRKPVGIWIRVSTEGESLEHHEKPRIHSITPNPKIRRLLIN